MGNNRVVATKGSKDSSGTIIHGTGMKSMSGIKCFMKRSDE